MDNLSSAFYNLHSNKLILGYIVNKWSLTLALSIVFILLTNIYSNGQSDYNLKCQLKVLKSNYELDEKIEVNFLVKNESYQPTEVSLSERPYYNFSFSIKSVLNKEIGEKEEFYYEKIDNQNKRDKIKTITLAQGQYYGQSFNLTENYKLDKPGHYIIQGFFYPKPYNKHTSLTQENQIVQKTQIIQIEIRKSRNQELVALQEKIAEDEDLEKFRNPYETIDFLLQARIETKWKRFYKYIDLHRLIIQYPKFYKRYLALRPSKREPIILEFKDFLKEYLSEIGYNHLRRFEIYKSVIDNDKNEAKISVRIVYEGDGVLFKRKYLFYLYQQNKRWFMYSFKVENL